MTHEEACRLLAANAREYLEDEITIEAWERRVTAIISQAYFGGRPVPRAAPSDSLALDPGIRRSTQLGSRSPAAGHSRARAPGDAGVRGGS